MTDRGMVLVAIGPLYHRSEGMVSGVARLLKKDLYETGMLLAGKIPKILARLHNLQSAEQMAFELEALGLTAFVVAENELYKPASYFRAGKISFRDGTASFEGRTGRSRKLDTSDIFLILKGRLFKRHEIDVEKTSHKINISGTLLTGIPLIKKVTTTDKEIAIETGVFLRIYKKDSMDPEVEMLQNEIDYSFLGPRMAATTQGNFNLLAKRLLEAFPAALFNDRLMEEGKIDLSPLAPVDISVANCRLMHLYYAKQADQ